MRIFGIILSQTDLWLLGIAGALFLALVGFYLSDALARRNEYIVSAEKLFIILTKAKSPPSAVFSIQRIDLDTFERKLAPWKRRSFRKCVDAYYKAGKDSAPTKDKYGMVSKHDPTLMIAAINKLLKFTERK